MIEELARHRCFGDDGTQLVVVERRHVFVTQGSSGVREHRGAAWINLLDGEPVRYIDPSTFEVIATGELLTHDLGRCNCAPTVRVAAFDGMSKVASGTA